MRPKCSPLIVLIIAGGLVSCASQVPTVRQQHLSSWERQLQVYRTQQAAEIAQMRAATEASSRIDFVGDPQAWAKFAANTKSTLAKIETASELDGRIAQLSEFVTEMNRDPAPGVMDAWFIREADRVKSAVQWHSDLSQQFLGRSDDLLRSDFPHWMKEATEVSKWRGHILGRHKELELDYKQALAYYHDMGRVAADHKAAAERQAQVAPALMALGGSLLILNAQQQQLYGTLNRPRTCTLVRNTISCF